MIGLLALVVVSGGAYYLAEKFSAETSTPQPQETPPGREPGNLAFVGALGRLEPAGKVIRVAVPAEQSGVRIARLLVREGDLVKADQAVAELEGRRQQQAIVREAEQQVVVAERRLAQVKAGARRGDLAAQEAQVRRLTAELKNAQAERQRSAALFKTGDVAAGELETRRLTVETLQPDLERAQAALSSLAEVRPVDVSLAQAEVDSAQAAAQRARVALEMMSVRAWTGGQVLKINARPGEIIGPHGILELGDTSRMYVVAEVFERDIGRVRPGQPATITVRATNQTLQGEVETIGLQVGRRNIAETDPLADYDVRVVEVQIRLNEADSRRVSRLTNLRVDVRITTGGG